MVQFKLTVAQAIVKFLAQQHVSRDGASQRFFQGMWGIFGHGNVSGLGQALEEDPTFPYYQARNEQGMVHAAVAFAKHSRRLRAFACTSSIGPGATNMITGAATATINRLPVLLLPGDTFGVRQRGPVLQQLEVAGSFDLSVNDCFRPVSKFWDRINRWEQLAESLREAVRVLTCPMETGCVTIALPQDVQTECGLFPATMFTPATHIVPRQEPDPSTVKDAVNRLLRAERPLLIAGGGVYYSEAESELAVFAQLSGIPCAETQAGKGSLSFDHPQNLGAVGVTGTLVANEMARVADVVIAVGTRLSDFTTASGTQFSHPNVTFININISGRDAAKYAGIPLQGDCKAVLQRLGAILRERSFQVSRGLQQEVADRRAQWEQHRGLLVHGSAPDSLSQGEALGIINAVLQPEDTVVGAAGSLPGDMHKLLHVVGPGQYHMEYGYSCMGYEIAGGLGVAMAKTAGEVFVLVGDGSYLMLHSEIVTSLQEHRKLIVVLFVNQKFGCIDSLSRSCGSSGFGNEFRYRGADGALSGDLLAIDYVANARSLGAVAFAAGNAAELRNALAAARQTSKTTVIVLQIDPDGSIPAFATQWNVPVAAVSTSAKVQNARREWEQKFCGEVNSC